MNDNVFTERDYVVLRKVLLAYSEHLGPSARFVTEIANWQREVENLLYKVNDTLLQK